jgi:hypothetical protein
MTAVLEPQDAMMVVRVRIYKPKERQSAASPSGQVFSLFLICGGFAFFQYCGSVDARSTVPQAGLVEAP